MSLHKMISHAISRLSIAAAVGVLALAGAVEAGEWPQILGPNRNGVAINEQIVDSIPAQGPPVLWEATAGEGFAGVAVADGVAVIFHRQGNAEITQGLD